MLFRSIVLRKTGGINANFSRMASRIIFNVALPVLIFLKLSEVDVASLINVKQIVFCYLLTLVFYGGLWIAGHRWIADGPTRGAFIQGGFRSNFAVIGLTIAWAIFGEYGLSKTALLLSAIIPMNNILAVVALMMTQDQHRGLGWGRMLKMIVDNPLILATGVAIGFSLLDWRLPEVLMKTGQYLASMTLPLALLSIGGALTLDSLKNDMKLTGVSAAIKLVVLPVIATALAIQWGFLKEDLIAIYLLFASPTAVASYVMAEAMGSNGRLAGSIVLMSTLGSIISLSAGIYALKSMGFI